jgi:phosphotransferase system enzyme I (PtsI)
MCGEMANEGQFIPLLIGMGLREFSMQPAALLDVREQIRDLHAEELTQLVGRVLDNLDRTDPITLLEQLGIMH